MNTQHQALAKLIQDFAKNNPHRIEHAEKSLELLEKYKEDPTRPFFRGCFDDGHFTASVLVMNTKKTKVLLMHHVKLERWSQFWGHADGEKDLRNVALRELEEESWIREEEAQVSENIFNIDVHIMPAKKWEPAHIHYDVSFLAFVPEDIVFQRQESEVNDIGWLELEEVKKELHVWKYVSGLIEMIKQL